MNNQVKHYDVIVVGTGGASKLIHAADADFSKPTPKGGPSDWSPVKAHTT